MTVSGEFGSQRRPRGGGGSETIAQITALRRTGGPLNHAVYDMLRERLLEGRYPAGTRLPTDDLRAELGVSKQPVMEALRRLAADGVVQIVPQVGSAWSPATTCTRSRTSTCVWRLRRQHRRHRGAPAHRRPARRARRDIRADRCTTQRARRRGPVAWLPAVESAVPPRHRRHGAVTGDDRDQQAHVGSLRLPDQHRRCAAAPEFRAGRPARRPRTHPRRTARRDHASARDEMEQHIVTTAAVIQCESESARQVSYPAMGDLSRTAAPPDRAP